MKLNKIAFRNLVLISIITFGFIACDEDFSSIDSDIINNGNATNFNTTSEKFEVISYTDALEPVQTNGLGINMLGVYDDPIYGRSVSSVLTQVSNALVAPTFGNNVTLDSVVLTIPFFATNEGVSDEGAILYSLDSVLPRGDDFESIKLSLFENTYFLRDFDPNGDFDESQRYFSNQSASATEQIGTSEIEAIPIAVIDPLPISNKEVVLKAGPETDAEITARLSPRIRKVWNASDTDVINYWTNKIINQEGQQTLSNSNNFNDYFRGVYFKAEPLNDDGSLMLLNFGAQDSNITLHYSFDSPTVAGERDESTYVLTFSPTRINLIENQFLPLTDGDDVNGDEMLKLKGAQGSIAGIKLFNGETNDDDNSTDNTFEAWRKQFVNLNDEGEFESSKRLVNEANLVFYVDQSQVNGEEPERLYLYDRTNGSPLIDYSQDIINNTLPQFSIINHLGVLEKDETTNQGIRYKMRITSHINNLLINNTDNVELGLAVSGNVNLEEAVPQFREQSGNNQEIRTVPSSSIITPRGTVLHGNNSLDIDKRLMLEIIYTCLETDADCPD